MKQKLFLLFALLLTVTSTHAEEVDEDLTDNVVEERVFRKGRRSGRIRNQDSKYSREMRLGSVRVQGNGCPAGTTSIALSDDKRTITLLFDRFVNQVGGRSGRKNEIKRCRVRAPLHVPPGYQVAIVALDYRGYNFLPQGGRTVLKTAHFFSRDSDRSKGEKKVVRKFDFAGPIDEEFLLTSEAESEPIWSVCGRNTHIGFTTVLRTQTNRQEEEALSTVDSVDAAIGTSTVESANRLQYHLFWRSCGS